MNDNPIVAFVFLVLMLAFIGGSIYGFIYRDYYAEQRAVEELLESQRKFEERRGREARGEPEPTLNRWIGLQVREITRSAIFPNRRFD